VAELPDKTAVAASARDTPSALCRWFTVNALALVVQSLLAVAAGGLPSLLPERPSAHRRGPRFLVSAMFHVARAA